MKSTRSLAGALLVALSLGAASARAAEITLYQHDNFGGAQLTLRGYTPSFAGTGFDDRVGSIVVTSGRWELCTDAAFKGACAVYGPGEYATIDARLDTRYSSAREIGPERRGSYNDEERGAIELFDEPGFRGRSLRLSSDAEALARSGFNDRTASLIVTRGTWEVCTDVDYFGDCQSFPPGRYPELGFGFDHRISSARLSRSEPAAPVALAPANTTPVPPAPPRALLYSERDTRGTSLAVAGPVGDLGRSDFNDSTQSLVVESGNWLACRDTWFRGDCRVFGPGRYDDLAAFGFDGVISSIRPSDAPQAALSAPPASSAVPAAPAPEASRSAVLEFYSEPGFGGERLLLDRSIGALDRLNFDHRAASVVVLGGTWELCSNVRFSGSCAVYKPGRYPRMGELTRQVASVRRVD